MGPIAYNFFYFDININLFLIYVLIYNKYGNLNHINYSQDKFKSILESEVCTDINLQKLYDDVTILKSAKNSTKDQANMEVNQNKCESYNFNSMVEFNDLSASYNDQNYKVIAVTCSTEINEIIVNFIIDLKKEFENG